jgi:hypothetical protein
VPLKNVPLKNVPRRPRPEPRHAHGQAAPGYDLDVFVNCPFDQSYRPIRDAIIFAVFQCGLRPRCALENVNSGQVRIDKIAGLIRDCRWGIHDLSRTELNANSLPRFNMPLERGLFLGASRFGNPEQRLKTCLVLDREPYRFHQYVSDIAGQDIVSHGDDPARAIQGVRDWFAASLRSATPRLAGSGAIIARYHAFLLDLPRLCEWVERDPENLTFTDHAEAVSDWMVYAANPPAP